MQNLIKIILISLFIILLTIAYFYLSKKNKNKRTAFVRLWVQPINFQIDTTKRKEYELEVQEGTVIGKEYLNEDSVSEFSKIKIKSISSDSIVIKTTWLEATHLPGSPEEKDCNIIKVGKEVLFGTVADDAGIMCGLKILRIFSENG